MCKMPVQTVNFDLGEHLSFTGEPDLKRALAAFYGGCLTYGDQTENRPLLNSVQFLAING